MTVDELTDVIWRRLQAQQPESVDALDTRPRALLLGEPPWNYHKYNYVNQKPYEAIVLGLLPPGMLLHMPDDTVCQALLDGLPVLLWQEQSHHRQAAAPALRRALRAAERRLVEYGVQLIGKEDRLLTAERARQLRRTGQLPPPGCRLTPLAKDILEGTAT